MVSSIRVRGGVRAGCRAARHGGTGWMTTPGIGRIWSLCGTVTWIRLLGESSACSAQRRSSDSARHLGPSGAVRPTEGLTIGLASKGDVDAVVHSLPMAAAQSGAHGSRADAKFQGLGPGQHAVLKDSSSRQSSGNSRRHASPACPVHLAARTPTAWPVDRLCPWAPAAARPRRRTTHPADHGNHAVPPSRSGLGGTCAGCPSGLALLYVTGRGGWRSPPPPPGPSR